MPARRGGVHLGWHRGRQPGGAGRARPRRRHRGGHAPSSTTRCSTRSAPGAGTSSPSTPPGGSTSTRWTVSLDPEVSLVSVMLANNEVGTIQPLAEVARGSRRLAPNAVRAHRRGAGLRLARRRRARAPRPTWCRSAPTSSAVRRGWAPWSCATAPRWPRRLLGGGQERDRRPRHPGRGRHRGHGRGRPARRGRARRAGGAQRGADATGSWAGSWTAIDGVTASGIEAPRVAGIGHLCIDGVEREALLFLVEQDGRLRLGRVGVRQRARPSPRTCWRPWASTGPPRPVPCGCRWAGPPPTTTSTWPWPRARRGRAPPPLDRPGRDAGRGPDAGRRRGRARRRCRRRR